MPREDHYVPPGERAELQAEVETCDQDVDEARKNGDTQQLLAKLERGLYLRRRLNGEASNEVAIACRRLCEVCNCTATSMLQQGNMKPALELLKRAEQVSERSDVDRAITWNNMACYYRKIGKLRTAVTFLERALLIEEHVRNADAAQTHLNLCATLSQLQRHVDALYHAQSALIRIYEILSPLMLAGTLNLADAGAPGESKFEQVTVLCIAYHNLGVEHEYLKNFEAAICSYAEGFRWASGFLGGEHQLVGILRDSVDAVKVKLPASSNAVKKATDLCNEGWGPLRSAAASPQGGAGGGGGGPGSTVGSTSLKDLVTPRGDPGSVAGGSVVDAGGSVLDTPQDSKHDDIVGGTSRLASTYSAPDEHEDSLGSLNDD